MAVFNIADFIEIAADTVPEREALVCGEQRLRYADLERRSNCLAHFLESRGVGPGQHVGLYLYNCNEYLEAMFACFKIRAVPININFRYVSEELRYIIDNADLVTLIHGQEFIPCISEAQEDRSGVHTFVCVEDHSSEEPESIGALAYEEALAGQSPERDFPARSEDDLFILYTGGTTGLPKGVMWPHKDLIFGSFGGFGFTHPDGPIKKPEDMRARVKDGFHMRGMPLAPMMHGACWWYACIGLCSGHTLVLNPNRSLDGEQVWDIAEREKVIGISFVGDAMAIPLLDALCAHPGRWQLEGLISIGSGGAVFSETVQEEYRKIFPNIFITNTFGSSETGMQGVDDGTGGKGGGLGRIQRGEQADVITEDHRFVEPGSGEKGYLARSGYVPIGYYNDPEKTAKTFITVNGKRWVLTGDLATVDKEGGIIVFGRGVNCINSGGEKIFPEEVEQAIKAHAEVYDALVVASRDERFTERVAAVVQPRENCRPSLTSIQEECRKHIAGYKIPRELHFTEHIGRKPSGKPDYRWARQIVSEHKHLVE